MKPEFFKNQPAFRKWLEKNHNRKAELLVGFYKTKTGKESLTWPQSVEEALCFGWIDGIRKSIDNESYTIRFTPRRPNSVWSSVNIVKAEEMIRNGHMTAAGLSVYKMRKENLSRIYSFEQDEPVFEKAMEKQFRSNRTAWKYFCERPPYYKKTAIWWVISAKQEITRQKRLEQLIRDSSERQLIKQLRR